MNVSAAVAPRRPISPTSIASHAVLRLTSTSSSTTPPSGRRRARDRLEPKAASRRAASAMPRCASAAIASPARCTALGLALGDRVGTLAWNTQHHFETYYATMGAGLVCHTLNPRFTVAHLAAIDQRGGGPRARGRLQPRADAARAWRRCARRSSMSCCSMATPGEPPSMRRLEGEAVVARSVAGDARRAGRPGASSTRTRRPAFATRRARRARRRACSTRIAPTICTPCARCRPMRSALTAQRRRAGRACRCSMPMAGACLSPRPRSAPRSCCPAATPMAPASRPLMRDEGVTIAAGVQTRVAGRGRSSRARRRRAAEPEARARSAARNAPKP